MSSPAKSTISISSNVHKNSQASVGRSSKRPAPTLEQRISERLIISRHVITSPILQPSSNSPLGQSSNRLSPATSRMKAAASNHDNKPPKPKKSSIFKISLFNHALSHITNANAKVVESTAGIDTKNVDGLFGQLHRAQAIHKFQRELLREDKDLQVKLALGSGDDEDEELDDFHIPNYGRMLSDNRSPSAVCLTPHDEHEQLLLDLLPTEPSPIMAVAVALYPYLSWDLFLWRNPLASGIVFFGLTAILASLDNFGFAACISTASMVGLAATSIYNIIFYLAAGWNEGLDYDVVGDDGKLRRSDNSRTSYATTLLEQMQTQDQHPVVTSIINSRVSGAAADDKSFLQVINGIQQELESAASPGVISSAINLTTPAPPGMDNGSGDALQRLSDATLNAPSEKYIPPWLSYLHRHRKQLLAPLDAKVLLKKFLPVMNRMFGRIVDIVGARSSVPASLSFAATLYVLAWSIGTVSAQEVGFTLLFSAFILPRTFLTIRFIAHALLGERLLAGLFYGETVRRGDTKRHRWNDFSRMSVRKVLPPPPAGAVEASQRTSIRKT